MWFGPTAAFVSGGAPVTVKVPCGPLKPAPTPSKFVASDGAAVAPIADCTTGSGAEPGADTGYLCCLCSFFSFASGSAAGAMSRSGGEVSK
jgi:hypothetical protein